MVQVQAMQSVHMGMACLGAEKNKKGQKADKWRGRTARSGPPLAVPEREPKSQQAALHTTPRSCIMTWLALDQ